MTFMRVARRVGIVLAIGLGLLPNLTRAQPASVEPAAATYPMPQAPIPYTTPQPAGGMDSPTGVPGRTLWRDAIYDSC